MTNTTCRRNSSQKAWTPGSNPITQKSSNTPPLNGVSNQPRGTSKNLASSRETNTPDRHAHDRLMYLLANFVVCAPFESRSAFLDPSRTSDLTGRVHRTCVELSRQSKLSPRLDCCDLVTLSLPSHSMQSLLNLHMPFSRYGEWRNTACCSTDSGPV